MKPFVLTIAAMLVFVAAPRKAHACGGGANVGEAIAIAGTVLVLDGSLTLWDMGSPLFGHHPGNAYGVFELVVAAPQLAGAIYGYSQNQNPWNDTQRAWFGGWIAWSALLVAHGIWTVATQPPTNPDGKVPLPRQTQSPPRSSLVVALGPTYAPVGQQARQGFGLVGRF